LIIWADFPSGDPGLYGTDATKMADGLYAQRTSLVDDPHPTITGNVLVFGSAAEQRFVLPNNRQTVGVGLRYWPANFPVGTNLHELVRFRNVANIDHVKIGVDVNGYIQVINGSGTTIGASSGSVIVPGAWQHIEVKVLVDGSVGTLQVRVEGVTKVNLTGVNTRNHATDTNVYSLSIGEPSNANSTTFYIKDFVVWDATGTQNTDFLGTVQIMRLTPSSDVAMAWGKSSGTVGYDLINDSPPVDTNYISAGIGPIPAAATVELTDLPANVTSVKAVLPVYRATKTDGGDGNIQAGMISSGVTGNGTDRPITSAFTYWWDVIEKDPNTSAPWTPTNLNAARLTINRTV
jgi:hypothetical protein